MNIIYKKGSVLDATEPFILHGCNAQGRMGSGVALAIREKWPEAYEAYRNTYLSVGLRMGTISSAKSKDGKYILNAITQDTYGHDKKQYVCYDAIRTIMRNINFCCAGGFVAMPKIGAGLGGGDWNVIASIIEEESTRIHPVVYVL